MLRRLDAGPAGLLDLSLRDKSGSTPLHEAATCNSLALIDLLLTHGAEVDATDGTGETPLHKAARNGYVEAVERLLSSGASLAATNSEGQTPLHRAARGGHVQVAWLLILHGRPGGGPGAIPPPNFTMDGCCGGRR